MGRLLGSLRQTLDAKIRHPTAEPTKLAVYACHDTSVAGILCVHSACDLVSGPLTSCNRNPRNALDCFDNRWPPFTSHVCVGGSHGSLVLSVPADMSSRGQSCSNYPRAGSSPRLRTLSASASMVGPCTSRLARPMANTCPGRTAPFAHSRRSRKRFGKSRSVMTSGAGCVGKVGQAMLWRITLYLQALSWAMQVPLRKARSAKLFGAMQVHLRRVLRGAQDHAL